MCCCNEWSSLFMRIASLRLFTFQFQLWYVMLCRAPAGCWCDTKYWITPQRIIQLATADLIYDTARLHRCIVGKLPGEILDYWTLDPVGRSSSTDEGAVTATAAASTRTRDGRRIGCSRLFVRKTMRCFSASARLLCFHQQSWTTVPSAIRSRLETDRVYWPRVPLGVRTGADCSICKWYPYRRCVFADQSDIPRNEQLQLLSFDIRRNFYVLRRLRLASITHRSGCTDRACYNDTPVFCALNKLW